MCKVYSGFAFMFFFNTIGYYYLNLSLQQQIWKFGMFRNLSSQILSAKF